MAAIDDLTAEVTTTTTVEDSAAALINGFSTRLDAAVAAAKSGNDAPMVQLQSDLKTHGDALAASLTTKSIVLQHQQALCSEILGFSEEAQKVAYSEDVKQRAKKAVGSCLPHD